MINDLLKKSIAVGIILLFVGMIIFPSTGYKIENLSRPMPRGNNFYVGGNGSNNYSQIQDAINDASNGDFIFVFSGTYQHITVDKTLTLIGVNESGENPPLIFGGTNHDCVLISADECHFENFRIRNGDGGYSNDALILDSDNNSVISCLLHDTGCGLRLVSSSNNSIVDNKMTGGHFGIVLEGSSDNNLFMDNDIYSHNKNEIQGGGNRNIWQNNSVTGDLTGNGFVFSGCSKWFFQNNYIANNSRLGVQMSNCENITFINNRFVNNGLFISGDALFQLSSHSISGNTLNGKPICYYANENNISVPSNAGQILLANCSHCIIQAVYPPGADVGICLWYSSYNSVTSSRLNSTRFQEGIQLIESHNNVIANNFLSGPLLGINLINSSNNRIEDNIIQSMDYGMYLLKSEGNIINNNSVNNCRIGIKLEKSITNVFSNNDFLNCSWYGIEVLGNSITTIEMNCFKDCGRSSYCPGGGIYVVEVDGSTFSGNHFLRNEYGVIVDSATNIQILGNNFSDNDYGISIGWFSSAFVQRNNFFNNFVQAFFIKLFDFPHRNRWMRNYWSDRRMFRPYIIHGEMPIWFLPDVTTTIRWINIDWLPAQEPYDIPGMS